MRLFILFFSINTLIFAQTLSMSSMFEPYFKSYKSIDIVITKGVQESLENLKNMESNLSIVRADILFLINSGAEEFKWKEYAVLARTKAISYLYLVARDGVKLSTMSDFRNKKISIGVLSNLSNRYLKEVLIDEVEFQVEFKQYSLEESLHRIERGNLDILFAFATSDFEKTIKMNSLVSYPLLEEFKKKILKNKGFVETKKSVRADNYIVVSKKIDPSFLESVVKEFEEKKILLSEVSREVGTVHSKLSKIIAEREKEVDSKLLISDIASLQSKLSPTVGSIRRKVLTIKGEASQFKKKSQVYLYKSKADALLDDIELEKKSLELKGSNFKRWKAEKNIGSLEMLRSELESINMNLIRYDKRAEEIKREIKIELQREIEDEEERALADAKAEELRMNQPMPIQSNY